MSDGYTITYMPGIFCFGEEELGKQRQGTNCIPARKKRGELKWCDEREGNGVTRAFLRGEIRVRVEDAPITPLNKPARKRTPTAAS